jgi:hypothetical protein
MRRTAYRESEPAIAAEDADATIATAARAAFAKVDITTSVSRVFSPRVFRIA